MSDMDIDRNGSCIDYIEKRRSAGGGAADLSRNLFRIMKQKKKYLKNPRFQKKIDLKSTFNVMLHTDKVNTPETQV